MKNIEIKCMTFVRVETFAELGIKYISTLHKKKNVRDFTVKWWYYSGIK